MNYIGEDVNLQFQVLVGEKGKKPKPTTPMMASVSIYDPEGDVLITKQGCSIQGSTVKAHLKAKEMLDTKPGKHTAIFHIGLSGYGLKDHIMTFELFRMPVKKKILEKEHATINKSRG